VSGAAGENCPVRLSRSGASSCLFSWT
jgi:hypothetical protein